MITTIDPRLTEMGLPQYPSLPGNVDPQRIEEIRRTVYVGNLDPTVTAEQLLNFFSQVKNKICFPHNPPRTSYCESYQVKPKKNVLKCSEGLAIILTSEVCNIHLTLTSRNQQTIMVVLSLKSWC